MKSLFLFILFLIAGLAVPTYASPSFQIIISEIFADPTPSRGLPDKEYLELYNNSSSTINLDGFILQYNTSEVAFPSFELKPSAYIIICRRGNGELYEAYGDVLELSRFSLLNRGTTLILSDPNGDVSHKVTYSNEWYAEERDQGYSLEMIDLSFPCTGKSNWTSTASEQGGTPGTLNSVNASNPDLAGPKFLSKIVGVDTVLLQFDEILNNTTDELTLEIVEGIAISQVRFINDDTALQLILAEALSEDIIYSLRIEGLADCSGNIYADKEISLGNFPEPTLGDLELTEVLFNPFPDGEDFIEFRNSSGQVLNLRSLKAWNLDNDLLPAGLVNLFSNDFLLASDSIVCLTENKTQLLDTYSNSFADNIIEVSNLPSMSNTNGEIYIGTSLTVTIDSMVYSEDDHSTFIDDVEGVSLHSINNEWFSTSGTLGYATPGLVPNSIEESDSYITISPEIITPNGDGLEDELSIRINAGSESITVSAFVYNRYGNQLATLANNLFIGSAGDLSWQPQSNQFQAGYYYVMVLLNFPDKTLRKKIPFVIAYYN